VFSLAELSPSPPSSHLRLAPPSAPAPVGPVATTLAASARPSTATSACPSGATSASWIRPSSNPFLLPWIRPSYSMDSVAASWIRPLLESPPSPMDSPLLLHEFSRCFMDSPPPYPMDSPLLLHGFGCCFMDSPPPRIPSRSHGFSLLLAWIRPLHLSIRPFPPAPMDFANKLRMEGVLHFCRFDIATGYDFSYVSLQ
jgi:hypothetical protein